MSSYAIAVDEVTTVRNTSPVSNIFHHLSMRTNGAATAGTLKVQYRRPGSSILIDATTSDLTDIKDFGFTDPVAEWIFTPADVEGSIQIHVTDTATISGKPLTAREELFFGGNSGSVSFDDDVDTEITILHPELLNSNYSIFYTLSDGTDIDCRELRVIWDGVTAETHRWIERGDSFDYVTLSISDDSGNDGLPIFDVTAAGDGSKNLTLKYNIKIGVSHE